MTGIDTLVERIVARLVKPLKLQVDGYIARGEVALVNAARKCQTIQVRVLEGEVRKDVEHMETYGWTANPKPGAETVVLHIGGHRTHAIVIATPDRRYRVTGLLSGEVCMYDDLGQMVALRRTHVEAVSPTKVIVNAPAIEVGQGPTLSPAARVGDSIAGTIAPGLVMVPHPVSGLPVPNVAPVPITGAISTGSLIVKEA